MYYIVALMVGFAIVISMVQNARLSKDIPNTQTTVINFITGLLATGLVFILGGNALATYGQMAEVPFFGFIGGTLGVAVVFLSTVILRKVSIIAASMLMYTGQMLTGFLIDWLRGTDLTPMKILGCLLVIAGIYFNGYVDSKKNKHLAVQE